MTASELTEALHQLADPRYRHFALSLIPGETNVLGVRLPALRQLARRTARENWQELFSELEGAQTMELVMLRGMLPGYADEASLSERLSALARFIPHIRNWSICDSCCTTWRFARDHREEVLEFLLPRLHSGQEYIVRTAVVMFLLHYLPDRDWAAKTAALLPQIRCEAYYARMAIAWYCCELHLRHPQLSPTTLCTLAPELQQMAQRKIKESRRRTD